MTQPVAIIVVTWNSAHEIERCLAAALMEEPRELLVVDNGSRDDTLEVVRACAPRATVIALAENRGFAVGCNLGIATSSSPYVLMLNTDAVLTPGYVATLVAALEANPRAASAVGKLIYHEGTTRFIDSAGIELRQSTMSPLDRGHGEVDRGQYDLSGEIFGPSAAAALYRRAALEALDSAPFDEELFAYYEDVDLAWRLRRRGFLHLYVPSVTAEHARRGPDPKPLAIAARAFANRGLVWLKNDPLWHLLLCGPYLLGRELARLLRVTWQRPQMLGAVLACWRRAPGVVRRRWFG